MGATDLFWGGLSGTNLQFDRQTIALLEGLIRKISPNLILVHSPEDSHQDHLNLARATLSAGLCHCG